MCPMKKIRQGDNVACDGQMNKPYYGMFNENQNECTILVCACVNQSQQSNIK